MQKLRSFIVQTANLDDIPFPEPGKECFYPLYQKNGCKIELIRSHLKSPGELYLQSEDEWVLLSEGKAKLEINGEILMLEKGDHLLIEARTPHRVLETSENALWICVFSS